MSKLLIVESPNKVKKIASFLGAGWIVKASVGHIRDLPPKEMGVDIASGSFRPSYEITDDRAEKVVRELKAASKSASEVYLATDPDREGEAIAWHIKEALNLKNPRRVTFHEITQSAVRAAVASPREIDLHLVAAQEARRVVDRLVWYTVSGPLSSAVRRDPKFSGVKASAGRVQSPAARLVVERERAIRDFKPRDHLAVRLFFSGDWFADWIIKPHLAPGQEYLTDQALAARAAGVRMVKVREFKDGVATESPPALFTTSTLQQAASSAIKMRPEATMRAAQALFESGLITYIRTDSPTLSKEAEDEIRAYARGQGWSVPDQAPVYKAKGSNAQEAHEAIRPTHINDRMVDAPDDQQQLYSLIWRRAVASQLSVARYATRSARMEAEEGATLGYIANARTLSELGWRVVYEEDEGDDEFEKDSKNPVPRVEVGAVLPVSSGKVLAKKTKPPARYTEASLIRALEEHGVGRPSTYAAILANIEKRGYVSIKKRMLQAEPLGEAVIGLLEGKFSFADLQYTAGMEARLDEVAAGKARYKEIVTKLWSVLDRERGALPSYAAASLADPNAPVYPCPDCGKPMRSRNGSRGKFWGCSGYPKCKTTRPDDHGKPGTR